MRWGRVPAGWRCRLRWWDVEWQWRVLYPEPSVGSTHHPQAPLTATSLNRALRPLFLVLQTAPPAAPTSLPVWTSPALSRPSSASVVSELRPWPGCVWTSDRRRSMQLKDGRTAGMCACHACIGGGCAHVTLELAGIVCACHASVAHTPVPARLPNLPPVQPLQMPTSSSWAPSACPPATAAAVSSSYCAFWACGGVAMVAATARGCKCLHLGVGLVSGIGRLPARGRDATATSFAHRPIAPCLPLQATVWMCPPPAAPAPKTSATAPPTRLAPSA